MTEINTYSSYVRLGNELLQRYGFDANGDQRIDRDEIFLEYEGQFERLAGRDCDSATISYRDVLEEEGYTLAPSLEEQLENTGEPGIYSDTDPLVGSRYDASEAFARFIPTHSYYLNFYSDLYNGEHSQGSVASELMIPLEYRQTASTVVESYYEDFLRQFERTPQRAFFPCQGCIGQAEPLHTPIVDGHEENGVSLIRVDPEGLIAVYGGHSYYVLPQIIAIHEFGHIAASPTERATDIPDLPNSEAEDIVNRCEEIMIQDAIMRQILREQGRGVPDDQPLVYPLGIVTSNGTIPLGEFAVRIRSLVRQYGGTETALMSREFQNYIRPYYTPAAPH